MCASFLFRYCDAVRRPINFEKQEKRKERKKERKKESTINFRYSFFLLLTAYESFMSAGFSFVSQRLGILRQDNKRNFKTGTHRSCVSLSRYKNQSLFPLTAGVVTIHCS